MEKYRLIDLSLPLKAGGGFTNPAKIHYLGHEKRGAHLAETLGIPLADIGDRGNSFEEVAFLTTHSGTHIDAPWHYTPVVAGEKAMTIDEVPLEWCWGSGVKLDIPGKEAGEDITARELQEAAEGIRYRIKPGDIVLIHTGVSRYYGQADCDLKNPGVTREGTHWLADQGVKVVGIDSPCWDRPPRMMLDEIRRGVKGKYMQGHRAAGERGMCILEWLTNLDLVPPFGFQVAAFPVKIERASGGWTRAVAFLKN